MVPLGQILTPEQIARTLEIMKRPVTDTQKTAMLKEYYGQFAQELDRKGYNADFLAYAIPYWLGQSAEAAAKEEIRQAEEMTKNFLRGQRN